METTEDTRKNASGGIVWAILCMCCWLVLAFASFMSNENSAGIITLAIRIVTVAGFVTMIIALAKLGFDTFMCVNGKYRTTPSYWIAMLMMPTQVSVVLVVLGGIVSSN